MLSISTLGPACKPECKKLKPQLHTVQGALRAQASGSFHLDTSGMRHINTAGGGGGGGYGGQGMTPKGPQARTFLSAQAALLLRRSAFVVLLSQWQDSGLPRFGSHKHWVRFVVHFLKVDTSPGNFVILSRC